MKKIPFHWQILLGMILGVVVGWIGAQLHGGSVFIRNWIDPFGQIFINLLKVIAVPLVIVSLSKGIADLKDITTLSKIGGRTIALYLITTVFAVILGLILVNGFAPGNHISAETLAELSSDYTPVINDKINNSGNPSSSGPLDFFVKLVPQNIFNATTSNSNMLQVIFFTIFFSVCLLLLPAERQRPLIELFDVANDVMLKMVDFIMMTAPYAVFALIASLVVETTNGELFKALLGYALILLFGMTLLICFYVILVWSYAGLSPGFYLRGILPAQLVAFSTSSSMATLPVTMECVEENLGVENEVSSFVCPIGATVNMDATSLMQAIAAVFVCQVLGHELGFMDQLTIVLTATLASIGSAAVPSAGIIMLIMVLESVGFPSESLPVALAMILSIDRPLDMCRTIVNISGDSCVSVLVAKSLGKLNR